MHFMDVISTSIIVVIESSPPSPGELRFNVILFSITLMEMGWIYGDHMANLFLFNLNSIQNSNKNLTNYSAKNNYLHLFPELPKAVIQRWM